MGIVGYVAVAVVGFLIIGGKSMSVAERVDRLRKLAALKLVTERDLRVSVANYQDAVEHSASLAAFVGLVVGFGVGIVTLNPKAGLAALQLSQKLTAAINSAPDTLKPALILYRDRHARIAAEEDLLGLEPGISAQAVSRLRYEIESAQPGYVAPTAPPKGTFEDALNNLLF